ncbi:hypothetical protein [Salibacterium lacus]|uniref:Uncharacterized protein n=1 Tax=Salibacterium lacus TaxID=1898109 RepID=A0ABW5SYQ4_9BACI
MGFWENVKNDYREEKEKQDAKEQAKDEARQNESEKEKLAKTANFAIKGAAIWYLAPFIAIAGVLAIMVVVWIWGMIF